MSEEFEWPQEEGPAVADGEDGPAVESATDPDPATVDQDTISADPCPIAEAAADPVPVHNHDHDPDPDPAIVDQGAVEANPTVDGVDAATYIVLDSEATAAEAAPSQEDETPPAQEAGQGEVLLLTLLEAGLGGEDGSSGGGGDDGAGGDAAADSAADIAADAEADQITLHSASVASDGPAKIETRLAVREALLPPRRSARPRARPPRCRACGGPPGQGAGGYCEECTQAAGRRRSSSGGGGAGAEDGVGGGAGGAGGDGGAGEPAVPPCADCGRLFDSVASLVSHRTHEHGGTAHTCAFCSKVFQRRTDLKNHMNLHLGIKKSVCDVCGRQFSHMSNLYRHRRIHTGERPYVCSVCGKRFSQANALNAHTETHEVKSRHKCPFCPKKFRNRPRLTCHIRLMHQSAAQPVRRRFLARQFHCGVCGARLDSLTKLRRHQASHPADSLRCAVCHEAFSTAEELTRHGCSVPGRADDEEETVELSDGEELVTSASAAALPGPRLPRSSYMLSDSRERREEESAGLLAAAEQDTEVGRLMDEMVAVQSVGTQYDVDEILYLTETGRLDSPSLPSPPPPPPQPQTEEETSEEHIDEVIDSVARGDLGPPSAQRYPCSTCGRLFSRLQNLRQHEAMHDASLQRFKCSQCDKTFAWQQTRDRHMVNKHSGGVEKVECPDCGRLFLPDSLRGHIKRIHEKLRHFPCHYCPKLFHTRSELHGHLRTHTLERPYVCCTCGRQFSHLSHLRRHEDVHRRLQEESGQSYRPEIRRTYHPRHMPIRIAPRPPPLPPGPSGDIVKHSLESARISLRFEEGALPPGTRLVAAAPMAGIGQVAAMAPMGQLATMATMAPMATIAGVTGQQGLPQMAMPAAEPADDVMTAVVGPECTEIIIVECEV